MPNFRPRDPLPRAPALDALATHAVTTHRAAPAAVVAAAVAKPRGVVFGVGANGYLWPGGPLAHTTSVFDLASLTKPVTALVATRLARRGVVSLATPLGALVEEARDTPSATATIEQLLAHRAGLDAHVPLFAPLLNGQGIDRAIALIAAAAARRPECVGTPPEDGFAPFYSDVGYLLVGEALERVAGASLAALVEREINLPLGTRFRSAEALDVRRDDVAPTEEAAFRGGRVHALVHDENAWALGGSGVCGHAGLFGDATDVLVLGVALLAARAGAADDWLTGAQLEPLLRRRQGGSLRAGFDGKSGPASSAGTRFGPETFGHLGFTGTSLWIDPDAHLVGVLLTNRVYFGRDASAPRIRAARPDVYDGIAAWADALSVPTSPGRG